MRGSFRPGTGKRAGGLEPVELEMPIRYRSEGTSMQLDHQARATWTEEDNSEVTDRWLVPDAVE